MVVEGEISSQFSKLSINKSFFLFCDKMVQQKCLSENDRAVLDAIFSPSEIGGEISQLQYDADEDLPQDLQGI